MDPVDQRRIENIHESLRACNWRQAAAFCAGCAERLLPNYMAFSKQERWGSPNVLRFELDKCWPMITAEQIQRHEVEGDITAVERLIPHTEHFSFPFTTEAGVAAVAVLCCFACIRDKLSEYAVEASWQSINTVSHYLATRASLNGKHLNDEMIWSDPAWAQELDVQEKLCGIVSQWSATSLDSLEEVRKFCWNKGVSNIGLKWSANQIH
jgi:uncharacterized protein YjaG (DUF416 family)